MRAWEEVIFSRRSNCDCLILPLSHPNLTNDQIPCALLDPIPDLESLGLEPRNLFLNCLRWFLICGWVWELFNWACHGDLCGGLEYSLKNGASWRKRELFPKQKKKHPYFLKKKQTFSSLPFVHILQLLIFLCVSKHVLPSLPNNWDAVTHGIQALPLKSSQCYGEDRFWQSRYTW